MDSKQVVTDILTEIQRVKAEGATAVQIARLQEYLERFRDAIETTTETNAAKLQIVIQEQKDVAESNRQSQKERAESGREMFRTLITYGAEAMKAAILVNGGAAVALLAFLGSSKGISLARVPTFLLADAVLFLVGGVLCAAIAMATAYLTQFYYHQNQCVEPINVDGKMAPFFRYASMALVGSSYAVFAIGAWLAWLALKA
jgi:hypothetical protein